MDKVDGVRRYVIEFLAEEFTAVFFSLRERRTSRAGYGGFFSTETGSTFLKRVTVSLT